MCVRFPRTTDDAAHGEEAYALDEQGRREKTTHNGGMQQYPYSQIP